MKVSEVRVEGFGLRGWGVGFRGGCFKAVPRTIQEWRCTGVSRSYERGIPVSYEQGTPVERYGLHPIGRVWSGERQRERERWRDRQRETESERDREGERERERGRERETEAERQIERHSIRTGCCRKSCGLRYRPGMGPTIKHASHGNISGH